VVKNMVRHERRHKSGKQDADQHPR